MNRTEGLKEAMAKAGVTIKCMGEALFGYSFYMERTGKLGMFFTLETERKLRFSKEEGFKYDLKEVIKAAIKDDSEKVRKIFGRQYPIIKAIALEGV